MLLLLGSEMCTTFALVAHWLLLLWRSSGDCHSFIMIVEADFLFIDAFCYIPLANAMLVLVFLHLYQNPDLAFFPAVKSELRLHQ